MELWTTFYGEATLSMASPECSPTGFKTGKLKRWEVVTPETFFWAQRIEPALPEHEIKQKMELFCQRRWMSILIPQNDKYQRYIYQGWQFCKVMRSSERGAIPSNIKSQQVWKCWVLQKTTLWKYTGQGERGLGRRGGTKKNWNKMANAISWRKGQRSEDIVSISNLKAVKGVETKKIM